MKFTMLDSRAAHSNRDEHHSHHEHKTYTDKYQYLDDLLDKTYLVDYFLLHHDDSEITTSSARSTSNK
jgi:hypothetical protein